MFSEFSYIQWALIIVGVYNIVIFGIYGLDKFSAVSRSWRVSEKTLLLLALFFGSPGALLGMYFFRHKTKKMSFQLWLYLILLVQGALVYVIYHFFYPQ